MLAARRDATESRRAMLVRRIAAEPRADRITLNGAEASLTVCGWAFKFLLPDTYPCEPPKVFYRREKRDSPEWFWLEFHIDHMRSVDSPVVYVTEGLFGLALATIPDILETWKVATQHQADQITQRSDAIFDRAIDEPSVKASERLFAEARDLEAQAESLVASIPVVDDATHAALACELSGLPTDTTPEPAGASTPVEALPAAAPADSPLNRNVWVDDDEVTEALKALELYGTDADDSLKLEDLL